MEINTVDISEHDVSQGNFRGVFREARVKWDAGVDGSDDR